MPFLSLLHPKLLLIIFFWLTPSQSQVERRPGSCMSGLENHLVCSPSAHRVMLGCHARTAHRKTRIWQNKHPWGTWLLCPLLKHRQGRKTQAWTQNSVSSQGPCREENQRRAVWHCWANTPWTETLHKRIAKSSIQNTCAKTAGKNQVFGLGIAVLCHLMVAGRGWCPRGAASTPNWGAIHTGKGAGLISLPRPQGLHHSTPTHPENVSWVLWQHKQDKLASLGLCKFLFKKHLKKQC